MPHDVVVSELVSQLSAHPAAADLLAGEPLSVVAERLASDLEIFRGAEVSLALVEGKIAELVAHQLGIWAAACE